MRILAAGLPLRLKARLIGRMKDAEVKAVATGHEALEMLKEGRFDLVILNEDLGAPGAVETLERLHPLFAGPVLFCAAPNHPASFLSDLVRRLKVSAILQHPIDPEELVRRASIEMAVKVPVAEAAGQSQSAIPAALLPVWRKHEATNQSRVALLEEASQLELATLSDAERETTRRAAHQLAGSLGTFGMGQATLLAREAEDLLKHGASITPAQQARFVQLARSLEVQIADPSARISEPVQEAPEGVLLVFSSDDSWSAQVVQLATSEGWRAITTSDGLGLRKLFALETPRAVLLDVTDLSLNEGLSLADDLTGGGLQSSLVVALVQNLNHQLPPSVSTRLKSEDLHGLLEMLKQPQASIQPQRPPAQILAVDDDPVVLETIQALLRGLNVEIHPLQDPLHFWDKLRAVKPDMIILDVDLPFLGGLELCRALRSDPAYGGVPVLFLSAYNDSETVHRVFQAGGDDYIYKPVVGPELITRVSNRLQRTRAFEKAVFHSIGEEVEQLTQVEQGSDNLRPDLGLVVSDEVLAEGLIQLARGLGRSVSWVRGTAEEILAELTGPLERRPRIVILEDPDGVDFLRMLEGVGVPSHSHVWLMGELSYEEVLVAYESGAAGYVPLGLAGPSLQRWLKRVLKPDQAVQ
jgi:DNA-binding response OmpR family regulator